MIDSTPSFARIISAFILAVVMLLAYTKWQMRDRKDFSITRILKIAALTVAFGTAPLVAFWWWLIPRNKSVLLAAAFLPVFVLELIGFVKSRHIIRTKRQQNNSPPNLPSA